MDQLLGPKGMAVLLILIVYGVVRENPWWVPGHIYRKTERKLDALQELITATAVLVTRTVEADRLRAKDQTDEEVRR